MFTVQHVDVMWGHVLSEHNFEVYGEAIQFMNTLANSADFDQERDVLEFYLDGQELPVEIQYTATVTVGA